MRRGELKGWEDLPRIYSLEGIAGQLTFEAVRKQADKSTMYSVVYDFARDILGWEMPKKGTMNGGLRTSFLQIQLDVQKDRVLGKEGENLKRIEQWTGCKLHVFRQSKSYGWVVAIVGPRERLWEAEALVRKLRGWGRD